MAFRDYSTTPSANTTLSDGTYIGPNMLRNKVRPALQQIAADGKALADEVSQINLPLTVTSASGQSVSTRGLLAAIASPAAGQLAFLTESGREGPFYWSASDRSYEVGIDPAQGYAIPPSSDTTGASGAWLRRTDYFTPEMFGAQGGHANDMLAVQRAAKLAAEFKKPLRAGPNRYRFAEDFWYVGSLTTTAPAAGLLDHFRMEGKWKFEVYGEVGAQIIFQGGDYITVSDFDFDIVTSADRGGGQLYLVSCEHFKVGKITKIGTEAKAATYLSSGGSGLSIQSGCRHIEFDSVNVEWAGTLSGGVFVLNGHEIRGRYSRCVGGQDALDVSGSSYVTVLEVWGEETDEIVDCGNSPNCTVGKAHGRNVVNGITVKTEASAGAPSGPNDFTCELLEVEEWTGKLFRMSAGATVTQTLHNCKLSKVVARTTTADANTRAFYPAAGDLYPTETTKGFYVGYADIEMNDGAFIEMVPMVDYTFENIRSTAPTFCIESTPAGFTHETKGVWRNVKATGDFSTNHRSVTLEDFEVSGAITLIESRGSRLVRCKSKDSPTYGIDVQFNDNTVANKNIRLIHCESINNSTGAGTEYGIALRYVGTTGALENIHIANCYIDDTQGSPTSGGFTIANATTDHCHMSNTRARNMANASHYGFEGLNSTNSNNRILGPVETLFGSATLSMLHANRILSVNSTGTITVPADSTTVFPVDTRITIINRAGAAVTVAASGGVTITSQGGLLGVAQGGTAVLVKTAADTWSLTGERA